MKTQPSVRGEEPPMFLQRPSTGKSQDVRHILAKTFRELYTRDAIGPDTVKNLSVSKSGDDPYHERYVESLQKVFDERQRRLNEAAKLERHIMQAQARAMSADERELNRVAKSCDNYPELGLPPGRSHFRSCIDSELLKKHKLLSPEDYSTEEPITVPPPQAPKVPSYARETVSSQQHTRQSKLMDEDPQNFQSKAELQQSYMSDEGEFLDDGSQAPSFISESVEFPKRGAWKIHMHEEQREVDRKDLANLQAKVNYLRNPRHVPPSAPPGGKTLIKSNKTKPKEIGIHRKPELIKGGDSSVVFLVSPPVVVFKDYKVGKVYEMTLELKNVSCVMRQCGVIPPSTTYFSIGLGQFPGEHGLVAPGMSCHYNIRFAPDSLRDFDDLIKIKTQSSVPIMVKLQGRRQPPQLTLPSVLDTGYCLVGGYQVTQFIVKNKGGNGRFCIMPRSAWPTTSFKSVVKNGGVTLPPFEVRPSVLELMKGESGVIEVIFSPPSVKSYKQNMTLVCDNCHVRHFSIIGESQRAGVELVGVDKGLASTLPGELSDISAQHLIKFDDLNPFTYTDRTMVIKNTSKVALPFQWEIYKPEMAEEMDQEGRVRSVRVEDTDSVFTVLPPKGTLPPADSMEFTVTFAPPVVNTYHSVLHLKLQHIPQYEDHDSASVYNRLRQTTDEDEAQEEAESEGKADAIKRSQSNTVRKLKDLTALELEVKGVGVPLNVVLHPYAVYVPGQHLVGTTLKKRVTMANHSRSTVTFQWQPHSSENNILEVEPPFGELDPGMAMDLELSITGSLPGKIDHTIYCHVMNLDEPVHLHVEADFKIHLHCLAKKAGIQSPTVDKTNTKYSQLDQYLPYMVLKRMFGPLSIFDLGPAVMLEEPDVNFGLVNLGESVTREITISNMAQVTTRWMIKESEEMKDADDMIMDEFEFQPSEGELMPLEQKKIAIHFTPSQISTIKHVFVVNVEDGNECNIWAYAEVQSPQVCLASCEICMEDVYKDVPVQYEAVLVNQTLIPTKFSWGEIQGSHKDDCTVEIEEMKGVLDPREERHILVNFVAHRQGEISDVRIPCKIKGMEKPLYLGLFCDVKGLSVAYRTSLMGPLANEHFDEVQLDYGDKDLGSTPKLFLHIRNLSGITAPYSVQMDHFLAKPPTPPNKKDFSGPTHQMTVSQQRRVLLGRTPNLADPLSKTPTKAHADMCKAMLSQGNGVAFVPSPASGVLQPFREEIIELTAYSDMWGRYTDTLQVKVGELEMTPIPVSINVIGCPLRFQMTAAKPEQKPVVRFGTHVSGVSATNRTMAVNNTSPFDIRVDWKIFNMEEEDPKLLDLVVCFGEAFPKLDSEYKEIVPPWDMPEKPCRLPTEFLPNSADTTPGGTRQATWTGETSSEETNASYNRPKLVSTYFFPHEGVLADNPYCIKNKQMVVPARGSHNLQLSFKPLPTDRVTAEMDCTGYTLGYMSLEKGLMSMQQHPYLDGVMDEWHMFVCVTLQAKDQVSRVQGYEMIPLRLDMTAHLKPALLNIEPTDEEGMLYRTAMSDLLHDNGMVKAESLKICSTTLSNNTQTPLVFKLMIKKPFILVDVDPSSNREGATRTRETEMQTLRPQHHILVKVAFQITTDLLKQTDNTDSKEQQSQVTSAGQKIEIQDDLIVQFNNSSIQKVPLYATLSVPQLQLSKDTLDFGTCLVGQRRELQLLISNTTASHSVWTVSQVPQSAGTSVDTFVIEPSSGTLEAHITHVSNSKALLSVFFTAKHAECYETVFEFQGKLGEEPKTLYVKGQGSYDGRYEAMLDI